MPTHKGVECKLLIDGNIATEYGCEILGDNTCQVHVVAVAGSTYSFEFDFSGTGAKRHIYHLWADGLKVIRLTSTTTIGCKVENARIKGTNGVVEEHSLRFGNLQTTDEKYEHNENRPAAIANIGTLKWKIWRAEKNAAKSFGSSGEDIQLVKPIFEKALKGRACSHRTEIGEFVKLCAFDYNLKTTRIDHNGPYVQFIFRYASEDLLRSKGLLPRLPSPVDEDVSNMNAEEMQREIMRLRNNTSSLRIKREAQDEDSKEIVDIESDGPVVKKQKVVEYISLLDDD